MLSEKSDNDNNILRINNNKLIITIKIKLIYQILLMISIFVIGYIYYVSINEWTVFPYNSVAVPLHPLSNNNNNNNIGTAVPCNPASNHNDDDQGGWKGRSPSHVPVPCIAPNCKVLCYNDFTKLTESEMIQLDFELFNSDPPPLTCYRDEDNTKSKPIWFYPITFSIFPENLVDYRCQPIKHLPFATYDPGSGYSYDWGDEEYYFRLYRDSYYAITKKKGGWDCNRHYEIMHSGTMPYFLELENSPSRSVSFLPKKLLIEARDLPGVSNTKEIDFNKFDKNKYYQLLQRLQYHAEKRLTTVAMANYILRTIKPLLNADGLFINTTIKTVLYIGNLETDYIKDMMLNGFYHIFGGNLTSWKGEMFQTDWPTYKPYKPGIAQDVLKPTSFWGIGFSYNFRNYEFKEYFYRDRYIHGDVENVRNRIKNHEFDLIIYGSINRISVFLDDLPGFNYKKSQIIMIDGDDLNEWKLKRYTFAEKGIYFYRELLDDCNKL